MFSSDDVKLMSADFLFVWVCQKTGDTATSANMMSDGGKWCRGKEEGGGT